MPRKEDRWQNIEEILSFWDNENQIEEEKLQRKGLLKVVVPEGVRSIGYDAFGVCEQLKSVTLPQSGKATASHVTLHVPAISLEAYKNAECWNEVKCIVPTPGK